jgi:cell division protein FtsI/penicillin-binding protein 2
MAGFIGRKLQALAARRTAWRRARNLRTGARVAPSARVARARRAAAPSTSAPANASAIAPRAVLQFAQRTWIIAAAVLAALAGGVVIAVHARHLAAAAEPAIDIGPVAGIPANVDAFQLALPGAAFSVPAAPGVSVQATNGGALVLAAATNAATPVRIDLCAQLRDGASQRLMPVRIGYRFDDVARMVARSADAGARTVLRNLALADDDDTAMPQLQIAGAAMADFGDPSGTPLQLSWTSADPQVRWLGDASAGQITQGQNGAGALLRDGWLLFGEGRALRIERRASAGCPLAGELLVQQFRPGPRAIGKAMVTAYPTLGQPATAWLRAGQYQVQAAPRASLEDQALFDDLQAHGLVRLGASGLAELVPADLAAWQAAPGSARAADLAGWDAVKLDAPTVKLIKRLYRMADGVFVRAQVQVFNNERRLLAWRLRPDSAHGAWQASVGAAAASTSAAMPAAASRLFADLPQGWAPWTRVAGWPAAGSGSAAQLTLVLPRPAEGGETLPMMLIGRLVGVHGARLRIAPQGACTGRACPANDAAQLLALELLPGARSVTLDALPLAMAQLSGPSDEQYRHLRVRDGKLAWRALAAPSSLARAAANTVAAPADVVLEDRNGTLLWQAGEPTQAALDAGLAPLLGIRAEHTASIAGMLARLPAPDGLAHRARLTLDLAMQAASQQALDCVGMRRGHWNGKTCVGGQAVPAGRHAGMVILDTETGDVLAAAGAGTGDIKAANWAEVRDFDRSNPARSALRLPALQHDGGAHQSPGSTFKVISALGLEQAARHDPQLDALLGGMPLAAINRMAQQKGFAFQTNAAVYPIGTSQAHITNYKDQMLDRRAIDGRLGLAQALTYSLNTWFAWSGELSDRSLFGRAEGGAPNLQALDERALDSVRPIVGMAHKLGFEQSLKLDGGLLPADYPWAQWDALQASAAHIDPIHTRHELRQMAIGLRMQVTPLQMALAAGAIGQGSVIAPRLLLQLDRRDAALAPQAALGVRVDRIRAGMKGVVDIGTGAGAFRASNLEQVRRGLSGKTGTSPTPGRNGEDLSTVWFTGWLEPGSLPGQQHRLALAAFVSYSEASGGEHAAPIVAAVLGALAGQKPEQKGKSTLEAALVASPHVASLTRKTR